MIMEECDRQKLDELEQQLYQIAGSYLRTVRFCSSEDHLCTYCGGIKNSGESLCYACRKMRGEAQAAGFENMPIDYFGASVYALIPNGQTYKVMKDYKEPFGGSLGDRNVLLLQAILAVAMIGHRCCIERVSGCVPSSWAIVPSSRSSKRSGGRHPLESLVAGFMGDLPQVRLEGVKDKNRDFDPGRFRVIDNHDFDDVLDHVLLIDDSYTTGSAIQSCAGALKKVGARQISGYAIARLVKESYWPFALMRSFKRNVVFEPKYCPWSHTREP